MSTHTPGPWLLSDGGRTVYALTQYGFNRFWLSIDSCGRPNHDEAGPEECRANARLISAAPDLYEVARAVAHIGVDFGHGPFELTEADIQKARTAVAKVEVR